LLFPSKMTFSCKNKRLPITRSIWFKRLAHVISQIHLYLIVQPIHPFLLHQPPKPSPKTVVLLKTQHNTHHQLQPTSIFEPPPPQAQPTHAPWTLRTDNTSADAARSFIYTSLSETTGSGLPHMCTIARITRDSWGSAQRSFVGRT
jgi:hypothetical protein